MSKLREYYNRDDIKEEIIKFSKDREVALKYKGEFFGKRPNTIESKREIELEIDKGVTSFHCSEERWINPLLLESSNQTNIKENRKGWDLIIDIDGKFDYSRIVAKIIFDFFERLGINYSTIKFSGNKGFHIGIPFEAFTEEIFGIGKTKDLFPEAPRKIASYIVYEIKNEINREIIKYEGSIDEVAKKNNLKKEEIIDKEGNLKIDKLVEIDTLLISSRHLFRAPYSLNEKSGLVSIPIDPKRIMFFKKEEARIENVDPKKYENFKFLNYKKEHGKYGDILLVKSYEKDYENMFKEIIDYKDFNSEKIIVINETIPEKRFPETIKYILSNKIEDGRKRALFVLLTFLTCVNWDFENIEEIIKIWAQKQNLKENYYKSQINWFKRLNKKINPPNFNKDTYYRDIGIPKEVIEKDIKYNKKNNKNPLNCIRKK